jgi:hypothetical protein
MTKFSKRAQNLIADFRGLPRDNSPSTLKDEWSAERLFQDILKKYVAKSDRTIKAEIFENWSQIVGNMLCKLCKPLNITLAGALVIKVENSVVRQELFLQKEEILRRICETYPHSGIGTIIFSL